MVLHYGTWIYVLHDPNLLPKWILYYTPGIPLNTYLVVFRTTGGVGTNTSMVMYVCMYQAHHIGYGMYYLLWTHQYLY